ncbi:putative flap endonuclease-1-like 5' DNA nuclease [Ochrobactrum sp. 19YEA23]|uniref:50S ribosomal protein L21 n=1 Tax=Ochrobactrum sp. 19YEA23 TaxID=3039854 RepID=UPI0024795112|nr:putative flap endonuclease-1-like 5' DNA nuclease [Ochrobactrum sp. 19YEA23]
MPLLIIQLAILVAVAFIVGCVLGKLFRGKSKAMTDEERTIVAAALSTPAADEKPEPVQPVAAPVEVAAPLKDKKPEKVCAPKKAPVPDAEVVGGPLPVPATPPEEPSEPKDPGRPELLDAPREGRADKLTAINGIGNAIQTMLNALGVYHYDQIASWSDEETVWIERHIGFPRRIVRENWIAQAAKLAETTSKPAAKRPARAKKAPAKPKDKPVKKTDA